MGDHISPTHYKPAAEIPNNPPHIDGPHMCPRAATCPMDVLASAAGAPHCVCGGWCGGECIVQYFPPPVSTSMAITILLLPVMGLVGQHDMPVQ